MDETSPALPKPRKHRINYALAATLLASGATLVEAAAQCGAKNANVLRVGLNKRQVFASTATDLATQYASTLPKQRSQTLQVANDALAILSKRTREDLAEAVSKGAASLKHAEMGDIGTDRALKHAQTLKSVTETAKIVHAWSDDNSAKFVQINVLNQFSDADTENAQAIDVEVTPQTDVDEKTQV